MMTYFDDYYYGIAFSHCDEKETQMNGVGDDRDGVVGIENLAVLKKEDGKKDEEEDGKKEEEEGVEV